MKTLSKLFGLCVIAALISSSGLFAKNYILNSGDADMNIEVKRLPIFPMDLLQEGYSDASVVIAFEVDHNGELRDWIVVEATHPRFVDAIEQVIDTWDFSPPMINGESRSIVSRLKVNFKSSGSVLSFDMNSGLHSIRMNELTGFRSGNIGLTKVHELDQYPTIRYSVKPSVPSSVVNAHSGSKAVFTFYVDDKGAVRVPALSRIDGDVEPGMLLAAQEALIQWKFEPPKKKSKPAHIRLAQTFVFAN